MTMSVEHFIKLKIALRKMQQQVKDAELEMLEQMKPGESYKTALGTVTIATRKTWQYSDRIKEEIKALQQDARELGDAELKETQYVYYAKPRGL